MPKRSKYHSLNVSGKKQVQTKQIPHFPDEESEYEFWATANSADYVDWSNAQMLMLPKLKPSTKTISLRLPESMLNQIRILANKRDVPYQSLIKTMLHDQLQQALSSLNISGK
jgi:predicted DNA binding CopG/RHH family protein